ncbi:MAG: DUF547 domain-containing protein [Nitrospinae bacterium]|nr:DUF547 domain-containing protein [Nitrospinota bacterium]
MFRKFYFFLCLVIFLSSCATQLSSPRFINSNEDQLGEFYGPASWKKVLEKYVDEKGKVAFKKLASDYTDLLFYLDYIGKTSPDITEQDSKDKRKKIAFYINSYNALAMYGVVYHKIPRDFNKFIDRARFFKFTEFNIGGRHISLYDYENKIIRPAGDPRVHFALNCMVVDCPRLPDTPFTPENLDAQLNEAAIEFLNDSKKVSVNHSEKKVMVSEILKFYKEDFVNPNQSASLLEYVNQFRKDKIPSTYSLGFFKYDWTINTQ